VTATSIDVLWVCVTAPRFHWLVSLASRRITSSTAIAHRYNGMIELNV
jgi:hypothetical protein